MMPSGNCEACKKWVKSIEGDAGWKIGLGRCSNVPMFFDATQDSGEPDGLGLEESVVLKPEFHGVKALALDGSGYVAQLLTMPDFGCVCFVPNGR
jgi:hypothetical protein